MKPHGTHSEEDLDPMSAGYETVASRPVYADKVMSLRVDDVRMPGGQVAERAVLDRPAAVTIVPLDDTDRVFLLSQYRHPVGGYLIELPAGLADKPGETPFEAARRELYEEAALRAATWHILADMRVSPGAVNQLARVYLARDLTVVPDDERYELGQAGEFEEADFRTEWLSLDEAVARVHAGEIQNSATVAGLLAAASARALGWKPLRPADLPWPAPLTARTR
ncbi:NUDIX domain-containing protein [Pseudofrankia inefficax]|uniref:NUDIX hydrolase n=1 Tax=Pseudofrankia inefficax (strain DSM 45817 / CECT 9037 / DDB 130130 / EuI1c) TaxID=298654 RepID=E3IX61_PSEI1|nr:NUDIX hydrolase [Pseudofrankia inefficax]ADP83833.1 NUDIX hydrolase [Pseudofrankia inefficax]